ncbi:hypothetical protein FPOAC2_10366 [Fusarium poae]
MFQTELMRERLQVEATTHLKHLQEGAKKKRRRANYQFPGTAKDALYDPNYAHRHREGCVVCANDPSVFCESASKASCVEVGCDLKAVITRERSMDRVNSGDFSPEIFIGRIGSGNTVMKSGEDRDCIADEHDLIAFEMEGAGSWDEVPCIVVKGICNYADSHKNKGWQDFAAATAASVAKAILGRYAIHDGDRDTPSRNYHVPSIARTVSGNSFGNGTWINQGAVLGSLAYSDPARFLERTEDIGEQKWEKIINRWKRTNGCLNCGSGEHWERECQEFCGKCLYQGHKATWCNHPVRCLKCASLAYSIVKRPTDNA